MKPLIVLTRIAIAGIIWSIFFIEGIRVMLLVNWHFDIFNSQHWMIAYNLWMDGWTIRHSKEWAFVLIIVSFIPLWFTGWAALSVIQWEKHIKTLLKHSMALINQILNRPVNIIKSSTKIKQKKSYKEVRPRSPVALADAPGPKPSLSSSVSSPMASKPIKVEPIKIDTPAVSTTPATPKTAPTAPRSASTAPAESPSNSSFDHSLFQFDEEDDFSFDIDSFDEKEPKPEQEPAYVPPPKNNRANKPERDNNRSQKQEQNRKPQAPRNNNSVKAGGNSVLDSIKQKGYEVITGTTIKDVLIDFVGVSNKEIHLFLVDKEPGDWLADEERFNDEEPLWFSESSHRISPIRKVELVRIALQNKLKEYDLRYNVKAHVIIALGNIINAEDMFDIWNDMNIDVTRIDRGSPKELKLFSKALLDAIDTINKDKFEKIRKLVKNIN